MVSQLRSACGGHGERKTRNVLKLRNGYGDPGGAEKREGPQLRSGCGDQGERENCADATQRLWRPRGAEQFNIHSSWRSAAGRPGIWALGNLNAQNLRPLRRPGTGCSGTWICGAQGLGAQ